MTSTILTFAAILTLLSTHASAQSVDSARSVEDRNAPTQTLKGAVRDLNTLQPIRGAAVTIVGTKLGAYTKADGSFAIARLPVGRHTVQVASMGYEPATLQVVLTSGREGMIEVDLRAAVIKTEGVVVTGDPFKPINESSLVSTQSFTVEEMNRYAGGFGDPGRLAQNFAGVISTDDQQNDIVIRGGSPTELLWRLDGIDIPNPNHFGTQGASGGPINAINANLLANSDFLTGAFPAEYGNKLSGVFDLRTRKGNPDRYEFVGQIGFNGLEAMAEGPVPGVDRGSFIASYRKSTLQVFDMLGIDLGIGDVVPKYEDATVKLDLPLDDDNSLSVTALGGISNGDENDPPRARTGDLLTREGTDIGAAGITWTSFLSDELVGALTINTQYNRFRHERDSITGDSEGNMIDRDLWWQKNASEGSHGIRYRMTYAPDPSHTFIAGVEGRLLFYDLIERRLTLSADVDRGRLDASGEAGQGIAFVNWNWRPTEELTFASGVYTQYLGLNGTLSVEPRVSGSWSFTPTQSINAGFGVHRQMQPLIIYFNHPDNRNLDFTQSIHYVLGYSNRLASDLLGKIEGYYKDLSHAPVTRDHADAFSLLNVGPDFSPTSVRWPLASNGRGRAYGVDLTLTKHFTDRYYITVAGSFFRQEYTGSDGVWRYGVFDNRYVMNLLAGYEWQVSPSFTMEFGARFTVAGGRRYTPIDLDSSRAHRTTYLDNSRPYGAHFPDYIRLDTRIDFRNNFDGWALIYYVSALNTLNRVNVLHYHYSPFEDRIVSENQFGLIPVGGIRVEF